MHKGSGEFLVDGNVFEDERTKEIAKEHLKVRPGEEDERYFIKTLGISEVRTSDGAEVYNISPLSVMNGVSHRL